MTNYVLYKKEFDNKQVNFLLYLPDKILSFTDKVIYGTLYNYLCCKSKYYVADSLFALEQAVSEKRSNIYALIREQSNDLDKIGQYSKIICTSKSVYNNFEFGRYGATFRYDDEVSKKWVEDENFIRLPIDVDGLVNQDQLISILTHHVKYDLKTYNTYICSYEANR